MTSVTGTVVVLAVEVEVLVHILIQQILTGFLERARPSSPPLAWCYSMKKTDKSPLVWFLHFKSILIFD